MAARGPIDRPCGLLCGMDLAKITTIDVHPNNYMAFAKNLLLSSSNLACANYALYETVRFAFRVLRNPYYWILKHISSVLSAE